VGTGRDYEGVTYVVFGKNSFANNNLRGYSNGTDDFALRGNLYGIGRT